MTHSETSAPIGQDPEVEQRERYRELLEELRTVIPGVQVLFAFLLTVPFASRFAEIDQVGRIAFLVALVASGLAIVLFLTPAVYHRIAPRAERAERIKLSVVLTVAGMAVLTVAVTAGVYLVARFVFGPTVGWWVAGGVAGVAVLGWFLIPSLRRLSFDR